MIFFDLDNTLLDHDGAEQQAIRVFAARYSSQIQTCSDGIEQDWRRITDQQRARWRSGELSFEQLRRARISALFRTPLSDEQAERLSVEYYRLYRQHWMLFPDVLPALNILQQLSPLAIITNGFAFHQETKLRETGIRDYFRFMVISEEVGVAKPDQRIFQHALRRASEPASACWYIGNHPQLDAQAASDVGMKAVWLNRNRAENRVSTRVVRSLEGFADLVRMHG